ncbi:MAG: 6-phosphogluconolactonase [Parachlamydiales bacterium]|nr:6-phosphogluconolactonase [Parachlamydiales bacterium]
MQLDARRNIIIPGDDKKTLDYCVKSWIQIAKHAINKYGQFSVALSGGSTPKAIFERLVQEHRHDLDWSKVLLFWGDERSVEPDHPDSNFYMAMNCGFDDLPVQKYRMKAEKNLKENAAEYERIINERLPGGTFDLIMLGMGDDGHTASLFPHTEGLKESHKAVIANYVPQKTTWRMTFTYKQIHNARQIFVYVLGKNKANMVHRVLQGAETPEDFPSQNLGLVDHPATWILDEGAASLLQIQRD